MNLYTYIYTYIHIAYIYSVHVLYICICVYMYIFVYLSLFVYVFVYVYIYIHTHVYIYINEYTHYLETIKIKDDRGPIQSYQLDMDLSIVSVFVYGCTSVARVRGETCLKDFSDPAPHGGPRKSL